MLPVLPVLMVPLALWASSALQVRMVCRVLPAMMVLRVLPAIMVWTALPARKVLSAQTVLLVPLALQVM